MGRVAGVQEIVGSVSIERNALPLGTPFSGIARFVSKERPADVEVILDAIRRPLRVLCVLCGLKKFKTFSPQRSQRTAEQTRTSDADAEVTWTDASRIES
jgi:hypothetical protein